MPEAIEGFQERAAALLKDRHHGVLLTGVTLMLELCSIEPALIPVYQEQVPLLCKILRSLLMSGFMPEHDVGGITDPFLQVKVCQHMQPCTHVLFFSYMGNALSPYLLYTSGQLLHPPL